MMTGPASRVESTRAPGGVRSSRSKTTRVSGRSRYAPRAVSSGSSARIVPDADADRVDLGPHAAARAGSPHAEVSGVRRPGAAAMQPSRLIAAFRITNGRRFAHQREERLVEARSRPRAEADLDVHAVLRADTRTPGRCTSGFGSLDRGHDARDARFDDPDDARSGAAHVAARLERAIQRRRRARAPRPSSSACTSACGSPARCVVSLPDDDAVGATRRPRRPSDSGSSARGRARRETARGPCSRVGQTSVLPLLFEQPVDVLARAENGTRSSIPSPTPT